MLLIEEEKIGETKTQSGIILTASMSDLGPKKGTIVEVGEPENNHFNGGWIEMNFNVGEVVLYPDHSGVDVKDDDGKEYIIIHNKHIIAKVQN